MKYISKIVTVAVVGMLAFAGCTDADIANDNLSKDADQFKIARRIVFFNGITDKYLLSIEGFCSVKEDRKDGVAQLEVTCKTGDKKFKKHILGLSDNVTYFVEQVEAASVSANHYKVIFKPQAIVPEVEMPR